MRCSLCVKHKKKKSMTEGMRNFRTSTLTRHAEGGEHENALSAENMKSDFLKAVKKALPEKEAAVTIALEAVYWLAQENLPLHKYESLMRFLGHVKTPHTEKLDVGKNAKYTTDYSANDLLESLATVIRRDVDTHIHRSPFVSIFADESTDIGMSKKLVVFCRVLDPDTCTPKTYFLENVKVSSGTGQVVSQAILDCLEKREIPMSKIMGFGSDGAKAMTGRKEGVTGHLLRENPVILNFHCIAHPLALVSSQAANEIPHMMDYQETLTSLFLLFQSFSKYM